MKDLQERPSAIVDLSDPDLCLNRELSWLEFNRRVLAQATDASVPLLERLRFVAIFASNLDEFFMVRVAGLKRLAAAGVHVRSPDGRTPSEQLQAIAARLRPMVAAAAECLHEQLVPLLARRGVSLLSVHDAEPTQRAALDSYFEQQVFPVLTPLAVDPGHPFPYISNLSLSLAVSVRDRKTGQRHFARVKVPGVLPRFVSVPGEESRAGRSYVALEELIVANLDRLFPGMEIVEAYAFRVTRNSDLDLEEDEAEDLLMAIEQELRRRRFGAVVRLEVAEAMPDRVVTLLQDELEVGEADTYRLPGLLGLDALRELAGLDVPRLRWPTWSPQQHPRLAGDPATGHLAPADLFATIRAGDLLLHHPYDSFTGTVERFVTAAAEDPDVLAIKQTLYRTSGDSPIVHALIRAAERGKQVVALVELKARFDEEANIVWARALEKAGVHVVYGLVGLKTHCKVALVVRREGADTIRRYVHVGSGNYNPRTARDYTDVGLLSCRSDLGADATDLFNYLTGWARQDTYRQLLVAPVSLRERICELIEREIARGDEGRIRLKVNALADPPLVAALYRASAAGVRVDLLVRGICILRPEVPGVSDRVRVISIVGRFLEHERVYQFGDDFWLGSADWMPRNLDRRVEAMAPVTDRALTDRLRAILDICLADNTHAWRLRADGTWVRRTPADGEERCSSQETFLRAATARSR